MKNILLNMTLVAVTLCPSFAMPSGQDRQVSKELYKESYFNKYRLGSWLNFSACFMGGLGVVDEDSVWPYIAAGGLIAGSLLFYEYKSGGWVVEHNHSIDNVSLEKDTQKKDEDCEDTPFQYDYAPVVPFTRRSMVKPFIARCCVPTAMSLCCLPLFKEWTPLFSSVIFNVGLQSCINEASVQDRKSKITAFKQLEVARRQSICNKNRDVYKKAKEASHSRDSIVEKAFNKFLNKDVSADSLKELILFVAKEKPFFFSCNVLNEKTDKEENNSFENEDLKSLWYNVREKVREDLLAEESLFFKNISLLDDEAQQRLCKVYYSWTVESVYPKNLFRSSEYCSARLEMLYENPKNRFSGKFLINTKWVMLDLISEKKFSTILGICMLTRNNVFSDRIRSELLFAYSKLQNNFLDCDDKDLDALQRLYNIFLNRDDTRSKEEKLDQYLYSSSQKSGWN